MIRYMEVYYLAEGTMPRRFFKELAKSLDSAVRVSTINGKTYIGILQGYDPNTLSICLTDGKIEDGPSFGKIFIFGHQISEIILTEKPFDLAKLAARLEKLFPPGEVKYLEDARAIMVLNKVKVTEKGVEGSGLIADRVRQIYEQFVQEIASKEKQK